MHQTHRAVRLNNWHLCVSHRRLTLGWVTRAVAKDLIETLAVAYLVAKHPKAQTGGVRISTRGIELLSRRELDARDHTDNVTLVTISLIPIKTEFSGPPPGFLGYAAVFRDTAARVPCAFPPARQLPPV